LKAVLKLSNAKVTEEAMTELEQVIADHRQRMTD